MSVGVYISGMKMPKGCFYCIFNKHLDPETDMCVITRDAFDSTFRVIEHRKDNCPLLPVPEHGRLMDKDAVNLQDGPYEYDEWCEWALDQYMNAPIILPADKEETE